MKRKRDSTDSALVKNTTGSSIFSGWCQCADKTTSIGNDTLSCENSEGTTLTTKRNDGTSTYCYPPPALFYNCDWFQDAEIENLNTDTREDTPYVELRGICKNVKKYLDRNSAKEHVSPNSMLLTYKKAGNNNNRNEACTQKAKECSKLKASLWPLNGASPQAETMSCDEFPCMSTFQTGFT